jgi:hypothetical protein
VPGRSGFVFSRCRRCQDLDAQGVKILICSDCGYVADRPAPEPRPEDLALSLSYVRAQLPGLSPADRERFDYWLDIALSFGWGQEVAERAAFGRLLRFPPGGPRGGEQLRLVETSATKEAGDG